jgi:hypothetical protein
MSEIKETIDSILEKESIQNKHDNWNKLNRTDKLQKLHAFAEKYGRENELPLKDIKSLKMFFNDCLEKMKLIKSKDVEYNKENKEISSIPALHFKIDSRSFTLKNTDTKRVSTIKSLTPKRITEKNKIDKEHSVEVK